MGLNDSGYDLMQWLTPPAVSSGLSVYPIYKRVRISWRRVSEQGLRATVYHSLQTVLCTVRMTLNPVPSYLHPKTLFFSPEPETRNPKPLTRNPKP
jgi:hypothetical protein